MSSDQEDGVTGTTGVPTPDEQQRELLVVVGGDAPACEGGVCAL